MITSPRKIAYLALLASIREQSFIADTLDEWRLLESPSIRDFRFAQQIAYGTAQMALALDYLAKKLSAKNTLPRKLKEKVLLRLALYQCYFLDRVPDYAIGDEMSRIARHTCDSYFVHYLNAVIRKSIKAPLALPEGDSAQDLSIRYSYPLYYVEALLEQGTIEQAKQILAAGNQPAALMARVRPHVTKIMPNLQPITGSRMTLITHLENIDEITQSPDYYIQNQTPVTLVENLSKASSIKPKTILDLCASPGGKLIAIHDLYPNTTLFGNDISANKVNRLAENCKKYGVQAALTCSPGESFRSKGEPFDLIILDVPCSNSGVLNKRPEARWRLSEKALNELEKTQYNLLMHAQSLLSPQGELWFLTCSILQRENEQLIKRICKTSPLKCLWQQLILPNDEGWDGGFAALMKAEAV